MGSRMYVALVPPAEVLESVDDLVERMRERQHPQDPRRFRWIQHGDAHITLAFMASVADPEGLADSLTADLERVPPVEIGLSGSGAFPDPVSGRMLWLGIADPTGRLPGLARTIRSSAHSAGAQPEAGAFSAHLTLARCHRGDLTAEVDSLSGFRRPPWRAREVTLLESHLSRQGARHEVVARIRLNGLDRTQFRSPR